VMRSRSPVAGLPTLAAVLLASSCASSEHGPAARAPSPPAPTSVVEPGPSAPTGSVTPVESAGAATGEQQAPASSPPPAEESQDPSSSESEDIATFLASLPDALPARFELPEGWTLDPQSGLPVDLDGVLHSIGREFVPRVLRSPPSCWHAQLGEHSEVVNVFFGRAYIQVRGHCVNATIVYAATSKRAFELKQTMVMGTGCDVEPPEAEKVVALFEKTHDLRQRGAECALLDARGKSIAVLRAAPEGCQ
jgi:hypothetical protein